MCIMPESQYRSTCYRCKKNNHINIFSFFWTWVMQLYHKTPTTSIILREKNVTLVEENVIREESAVRTKRILIIDHLDWEVQIVKLKIFFLCFTTKNSVSEEKATVRQIMEQRISFWHEFCIISVRTEHNHEREMVRKTNGITIRPLTRICLYRTISQSKIVFNRLHYDEEMFICCEYSKAWMLVFIMRNCQIITVQLSGKICRYRDDAFLFNEKIRWTVPFQLFGGQLSQSVTRETIVFFNSGE